MKLAWKNLEDYNEKDFKVAWAASRVMREYIIELLRERIKAAENQQTRQDYDCPNWNLKQADHIGTIRTYKEIIALLDN